MRLEYKGGSYSPYLNQEDAEGYARVDFFPADSSIVIINGVYIPIRKQNQGIGSRQHKERLLLLKEAGYKHALCTVNEQNVRELAIVKKNGWQKLYDFDSNSLWAISLQTVTEDGIEDVAD